MRIEVLNTGSELLLGTTMNTHGGWFGQELFKLGLRVQRQTTVPDGDAIREALAECVGRSDVVLVTGGLGPTSDDITREAAAEVLGVELIEDEAAMRSLEAFFTVRGYEMSPDNRKQAQVLVGADVLPNPNGTAPGIYVPPRLNGAANCAVFLLPGPPRELYPMFHAEVTPRLRGLSGGETSDLVLEMKLAGVGESTVHHEIDKKLAAIPGLEVGYCARMSEVDVRLIGSPEAIAMGREITLAAFGDLCFSEDGSSLEEVVVRRLTEKGLKLAIAESCTGGLIANRVTDVPGSSAVLTHGFVTYSNEAKQDLLGISWDDLEGVGAVSETVAKQMAEGALRVSGADVAVSVTGIAGPGGGTDEKPVGTVFLALAVKGGETLVREKHYFRDRLAFKQTVSQTALEMVLKAAGNVAHTSGLRESRPSSGRLVFRPFVKEGKEVTKSHRRLPHWQQEGACYYITFRLGDSMPASVMDAWRTRRAIWLELHGIKAKKEDRIDVSGLALDHQREYRRVFGEEFQRQLDRGHGSCLLRKPANAKVVADTLLHFDGERYDVGDFVVMPNHVHVLVVPKEGHTLSEILKSWKGFSARQINLLEGKEGALWQKESFDHIIRSRRQLDVVREYIRENPNVAKLRDGEFVVRGVEWE